MNKEQQLNEGQGQPPSFDQGNSNNQIPLDENRTIEMDNENPKIDYDGKES